MYRHECGSGCDGYVAAPSSPALMEPLAPPTLPWHYISAVSCLVRGTAVLTRPDNSSDPPVVSKSLHRRLVELGTTPSGYQALLAACAETQAGEAPGGLFSYVRPIGSTAGKAYYGWTAAWPAAFGIRLRTGAPDLLLSPTGLVVPLPFPEPTDSEEVSPTLNARLAAARASHSLGPHPALGTVAGDPTVGTAASTGVCLTPFMKAVDEAIGPCFPATRKLFADVRGTPADAKEWLVTQAKTHDADFVCPDTLTVSVDDLLTTPETAWQIVGGQLHLRIGWQPHPQREKCPDPVKSITLDHWPCGAFTKR